ncbi:MAG: penicillin-binding protein 2 [Deltaproteobacteria bacterium]|nr:penicillin-binding protein 2 [Deltaproteobacteria bacterium]
MSRLIVNDDSEFSRKYRYALIFVVSIFLILVGRLVQLQIVYGNQYRVLSKNNFLQKRTEEAPRGLILDANGKILARNRVAYNVFVIPQFFKKKAYDFLVNLLELSQTEIEYIKQKIMLAEGRKRTFSLLALRDIPKEWALILESNKDSLPGLEIVPQEKRFYPQSMLASHIIGFMGEISAEDKQNFPEMNYRDQDWRGKSGTEFQFESNLRGKRGYRWRVLDARGRAQHDKDAARWLPDPWKKDPVPGNNIYLTIDSDYQNIVEHAMSRYISGAAVMVEVKTGRILAYSSKPAFDPNELSGKLTPSRANELYSSPLHPMLDKVLQGTYFPGSTYKIIPAVAAMEEKLIDFEEFHLCKGWYEYGRNSSFACSHAHGLMNLETAIISSCNVFFFMLSERVGMDRMARYARLFGFGSPTGIHFNFEKSGFIPTKQWYAQKFQEGFRIGHTLNSAIGQGNVKVTVLQLAMAYAAIANHGTLYEPQLIERITTWDGNPVKDFKVKVKRKLGFKPETWDFLIKSLAGVVDDPSGTAYKARTPGLKVAGKTGTAQVRGMKKDGSDTRESKWRFQDHAWFAGFAPYDDPEIVVVVLVEHGGFAAKAAVPLTMKIFEGYFNSKAIKKGRNK